MKTLKMILMGAVLIGASSLTSCKKDYTCTCTTVVGGVSGDNTHSVDNSTYVDAKRSCKNYEDQANNTGVGSTTCRL